MFYRFCRLIIKIFLKFFFHLQISGKKNLYKVKGAVFAVNHASYLDPLIAGTAAPIPIYFLARKTLFDNKLFNWWGRKVRAIPFNRDAPDSAGIKNIIRILRQGKVVLIFPEGTRTLDGRLQKPHSGVGFIALKAAVPIVPAYIKGSYNALPKDQKFIKLSKLSINIGEPISIDKWLNKKDTGRADYEQIADLIMERIKGLSKISG